MREYDPIVGRWTSKDPAGQYYSPYVGMANDPINRTDPDGGFDWFLNNASGEIKQFEGETVKEGWSSIAGDNATTQDIYNGLDALVGFHNIYFDEATGKEFLNIRYAQNFELWKLYGANIAAATGYYGALGKAPTPKGPQLKAVPTTGEKMVTVGRWMSKTEYEMMVKSGRMIEGAGGQTFVATGGSTAFSAAAKGSVYVEFQVAAKSLLQAGHPDWLKAVGPNASKAMQSALQKQGGQLLPKVQNISPILKTN